ncbi:MAG: MBL fold metallo-hydrolase [Muribaculaceae bacterium]|nr:MBL fold metallo-hydrolase [Muribaculaceae bacterium]
MKKIRFDRHPQLPLWEDSIGFEEQRNPDFRSGIESDLMETDYSTANRRPKMHYISFASGSSGNSCYIGTERGGVIIDAGVRADIIEDTLRRHGISMRQVHGLLLTHDHSDHVRYSYNLLRNNRHLTLFCTPRVLNGLLRRHSISRRIKEYHTPIFKEIPFKVADMEFTAFEVPHDGSDNMGFSVVYDTHRFVLATDIGSVTSRAHFYMSQANYLVIEANYDSDMLRVGPYPEYLKARIRSGSGHLDNRDTAAFLSEVMNPELKYVFLCHLSQDNNTPAKALGEVCRALEEQGFCVGRGENGISDRKADVQLIALPRFEPTRKFIFD